MKEISRDSPGAGIYDQLAQALVRGLLRPDQKVTIRGLAEMLGTSSTPARDAIRRMLQDQVLEQRSPRDVRVPVLKAARYLEIARIRMELEGMSAEQAAERATASDIARLRRIVTQTEKAMAENRWIRAVEYNQRFHFALATMADMPVLLSILHRLWLQMGPLIAGYYESAHEDPGIIATSSRHVSPGMVPPHAQPCAPISKRQGKVLSATSPASTQIEN